MSALGDGIRAGVHPHPQCAAGQLVDAAALPPASPRRSRHEGRIDPLVSYLVSWSRRLGVSVNVSAGQSGGDEGNRTPNPRLAKRDEPYRALPANVVLCVLVLVTRCPTASVVNERQRSCRLFADFVNTGAGSTVFGRPAALMICGRRANRCCGPARQLPRQGERSERISWCRAVLTSAI